VAGAAEDFGPDNQIGNPGLVLDRDKHNRVGAAGSATTTIATDSCPVGWGSAVITRPKPRQSQPATAATTATLNPNPLPTSWITVRKRRRSRGGKTDAAAAVFVIDIG
jgi:L-alanine-DL-glutamate epimerase-like enolase superfamily enzyme